MIEGLGDVLTESKSSSPWRDTPAMPIIWVRPKQITHWSFVRHLHLPIDLSDLLKSVKVGRKSSMKAENLILHNCGKREQIK
jgi:hypothetical protein